MSEWVRSKRRIRTTSADSDLSGEDIKTFHSSISTPAAQEDELDKKQTAVLVREAISSLPAREKDVIQRRFFDEETLEAVGESWGVTRERIRQIEKDALCTLRKKLQSLSS